jgi:Flp pilus assembly protein TadB
MPAGDRVEELARRARAGSFEHRLAGDLMEAADEGARVAAVNDALADIEQALAEGERWPASAARIAAWGTMLIGVVAFLAQVGTSILAIAGIGGASTIASLGAMRWASQAARDRREAIDALVIALLGRPAPGGEREREGEGASSGSARRRIRSSLRRSGPASKR